MDEVTTIGLDLAKRVFSSARRKWVRHAVAQPQAPAG
jgi:hypothetical protein